jgi:hypothetical protein
MNIHRQTELDAINSMLATIGEAPISTLSSGLHADATMAIDTLRQVSREVQQVGWYFNREFKYELIPNTDGNIVLPLNIASIDVESRNTNTMDVVPRGNRLYDMTGHTYTFDNKITATVIFILPFDELPEIAKTYITIRASRLFLARVVGSETLMSFTRQDEMTAYAALRQEQIRKTDRTFLYPDRKSHHGMNTPERTLRRRM